MGEETQLVFKFDDLSGEVKDYYYTVIHCDADWNESFIPQSDYIDGFPENPLNDFARSFNTTFNYINYRLYLPNENLQFKLSGNYALIVYENGNKENVILSKRFYVVEPWWMWKEQCAGQHSMLLKAKTMRWILPFFTRTCPLKIHSRK
jgi:hypothetical protein